MVTKPVKVVAYRKELPPINCMASVWDSLVSSRYKLNLLNLQLQKPMDTKLGQVLTYNDRLLPLKPHDPLITWLARSHVIISKIYISTFTKLMASKLGRVLTLGRLSIQTLSSSPTSSYKVQSYKGSERNQIDWFVSKLKYFENSIDDAQKRFHIMPHSISFIWLLFQRYSAVKPRKGFSKTSGNL